MVDEDYEEEFVDDEDEIFDDEDEDEDLEDEEDLSPEEEGFLKGYKEAGKRKTEEEELL